MGIKTVEESANFYLTPVQAAEILNISLSTLKKMIYTGELKTFKTPGGHHRILRCDLFLHAQAQGVSSRSQVFDQEPAFTVAAALVNILETKQIFCQGHCAQAAKISLKIAQDMGFESDRLEYLYLAAFLRNIGMLGLNEHILNKPAPLNEIEFAEFKNHPALGEKMANSIDCLKDISGIIRQHHEYYDGSGYPDGLKADGISKEARIISVADAFSAMISRDSYKRSNSVIEAREEIRNKSGTQFDPEITKVFLETINE